MAEDKLPNIRSTLLQAFAVTVKDESQAPDQPSNQAPEGERKSSFSRAPAIPLPGRGDIIDDNYILTTLLGEGAFGKVYVAQRIDVPEHQVALKILPRAVYEGRNVERELVMLATVGHPNVVQLKDHGTGPDYVWFTMPVYEGETLEERLKRGPLSIREAYDIFVPVARGLEALHLAGLRHQDIKPDNIYLAIFGGRVHPVLLDLGVAAEREATFVAGTLLYASPEQIAYLAGKPGTAVLNEKMDTYGLATTLLMALSGPEYFPGNNAETAEQIEAAHKVRAEHPLGPKVLLELVGNSRDMLEECFKRWLALDPKDRPTMSELASELDVLLEPEREAARAEERKRLRQKNALFRVSLAAIALLLIAVGGGYYIYSKRESLALVSALEKAEREGAESFDKLDTCIASHTLEKKATASCRAEREKDKSEFQMALDALKKAGSTTAERAKQIELLQNHYAARLKACEDTNEKNLKAAADEKARLETAWHQEKEALIKERDEQKKIVETYKKDLEVCDKARHACFEERETWKAQIPAPGQIPPPSIPTAPGTPPPPPNPGDSASPPPPPPTTAPTIPPPSTPTTPPPPPPPPKTDPTTL